MYLKFSGYKITSIFFGSIKRWKKSRKQNEWHDGRERSERNWNHILLPATVNLKNLPISTERKSWNLPSRDQWRCALSRETCAQASKRFVNQKQHQSGLLDVKCFDHEQEAIKSRFGWHPKRTQVDLTFYKIKKKSKWNSQSSDQNQIRGGRNLMLGDTERCFL